MQRFLVQLVGNKTYATDAEGSWWCGVFTDWQGRPAVGDAEQLAGGTMYPSSEDEYRAEVARVWGPTCPV